jgi:hypothetical protein
VGNGRGRRESTSSFTLIPTLPRVMNLVSIYTT